MAGEQESFEEFWQHYLRHHAQGGTRMLHVFGTGLGVLALIVGLVTVNPMIALIGTGDRLSVRLGRAFPRRAEPAGDGLAPDLVVPMRHPHVPPDADRAARPRA